MLRQVLKKPVLIVGFCVMMVVLAVVVLAPWIAEHDPGDVQPLRRLQAPSREHPFGTDDIGRDVFSRVLFGGRLSLLIGASVALVVTVIGTAIGLITGFFDGADKIIMRIMDGMMAFPAILLAVALMAALGSSVLNVIAAISVVYIPRMVRVVRSGVLVNREQAFAEAAKASGASNYRIMFRHILPNCVGPLTVQSTFILAQAMLIESSLSFLGVGVPPYIPSWGNVLAGARLVIQVAPWVIWFPGIAIILAVLSANLMGDGLRDVIDPHMRGS